MKTLTSILLCLVLGSSVSLAESWTSSDGRRAEMKLLEVLEEDGELTGRFRLKNSQIVKIKASKLSENDAERLKEKSTELVKVNAPTSDSVFDNALSGNLLQLDDTKVEPLTTATAPAKYYVFYYTAAWCGPCQGYTPQLVDFYNKHKNDNFEVVVVSWDRQQSDLNSYAVKKHMPWPLLKLSKAGSFQRKFNHKVSGIPSVITCDLEGNIVSRSKFIPELIELVK